MLLILGNVIAFLGSALMAGIGLIKNKKKILGAQCLMYVLFTAANALLGGISGAIANGLSLIRNLFCFKQDKLPLWMKIVFIALQIGLTVAFNQEGWFAYLPLIAACIYTFFMDRGDAVSLKYLIIFAQALWLIYDLSIQNYSGFAFDILTVILNIVGILTIKKERKEASQ